MVPEVKLQAHQESEAGDWQLVIHKARADTTRVFTDWSMGEEGNVRMG